MSPERWQKLNAILDQAMVLPAQERADFLDQACGDDADLRREIDELLALETAADDFLDVPMARLEPADLRTTAPGRGAIPTADQETILRQSAMDTPVPVRMAPEPRVGDRIGPYRIVELLGRGGMGEVYLATRVDDFEQRVALKLLPRETRQSEVFFRFRTERQIQARLEHPGISRLLDGGTTEDGSPYFAMEYVDGEPIDDYCERHRLGVRQRLALFRKVCAAVQFAHQQLVVHRDLKPSNILVTRDGEPKLLDFGIAKFLRPEPAVTWFETRPGSSPMTLRYASPEQINAETISTASDVYSLGVLLYELLTGRLPGGLEEAKMIEAVRSICDEEPEPPSSMIGGGRTARQLRGDLDAIVLRALRKRPAERYASAEQFSDDLRRHLEGLPVEARRGTWLYQAGKFIRRQRRPLLALATLILLALGFAAFEWRRLGAERERAEKVTEFLEGLFLAADPDEDGRQLDVYDLLARGRDELSTFADEPELRTSLAETLGRIHQRLGLYGEARELTAEALASWRRENPGDSPELARRLSNLGAIEYHLGSYGEAESLFREALEARRRLGQDDVELVRTINNLAGVLALRGNLGEAEELYREGLERRRQWNPESAEVATSLRHLGWVLLEQGDAAAAEPFLRESLELHRAHFGARHTAVARVLHMLGDVLLTLGELDEAETLLAEALAQRRALLGDEHLATASTRGRLAALLLSRHEAPETVGVLLTRALTAFYRVKPPGDWEIARTESLLGAHLAAQNRDAMAEVCLKRGLEGLQESRGETARSTREARQRLADFYEERGRSEPMPP